MTGAAKSAPAPRQRKLSYKDQRELDGLPDRIEALESEIAALAETTGSPEFYRQDSDTVAASLAELEAKQLELDHCMERWMELGD